MSAQPDQHPDKQPGKKDMMLLDLPDIEGLAFDKKTLLDAAQNELHAFYTTNDDPMYRARSAATAAVLNAAAVEVARTLEGRITELYRSHEIINEPRDELADDDAKAGWDEAFAVWLWKYAEQIRHLISDEDRWEEIAGAEVGFHEVGRIAEIAAALAAELKPHYAPPDNGVGKFLSGYGIVDADLKKLATAAKKIPIPPAPVVEPKVVLARTEPQPQPPLLPPTDAVVPPTKDELANAVGWWWEGSGPDPKDAAENLEISVGTLRNYVARKTMPKVNSSQARYLAGDCRDCIEKLQRALAIFERVKSVGDD